MKKSNMKLSIASVIVFGLVGCNSNLNTSQPISPISRAAKKPMSAGSTTVVANTNAAAAAPTIDMIEGLPGTWICNETLSAPVQCLDGETVIVTPDMQTLDVHTLNQEINSDNKNTCDIDATYKLVAGKYTSGNSMTGTLTSTDVSLITGTQNDASCETDVSAVNKNASVTYAATFTVNTPKGGNTLTLSLTNVKGVSLQKIYVASVPSQSPNTSTATAAQANDSAALANSDAKTPQSSLPASSTSSAAAVTPAAAQ